MEHLVEIEFYEVEKWHTDFPNTYCVTGNEIWMILYERVVYLSITSKNQFQLYNQQLRIYF